MYRLVFLLLFSLFWGCQTTPANEEEDLGYAKTYLQNSAAVDLAEAQLTAYNKRDLEAFLVPYGDSVKVFNDLEAFGYQGKATMRENYKSWFSQVDSLHCTVVNRIATANTVIDHEEVVYRIAGKQELIRFEAIAIYKIGDEKIQEVHFVQPQ
ncbi:MAG: nuclear transport factor 2 family protein [Bacteroidota bacterium]